MIGMRTRAGQRGIAHALTETKLRRFPGDASDSRRHPAGTCERPPFDKMASDTLKRS